MKFFGYSDIGKKRSVNQDRFLIETYKNGYTLCAVFDGMGGVNGGAVASEMAFTIFADMVRNGIEAEAPDGGEPSSATVRRILQEASASASEQITERGSCDEELSGMGTTLVAALFTSGSVFIINIGDSRLYGIYGYGIKQITKDHSYVQYLVDKGLLDARDASAHPKKNIITRSVGGGGSAEADFFTLDFIPPCILLCSDGLTNEVDDDTIYETLTDTTLAVDKKANTLVDLANKAGGRDNITVILAVNDETIH